VHCIRVISEAKDKGVAIFGRLKELAAFKDFDESDFVVRPILNSVFV